MPIAKSLPNKRKSILKAKLRLRRATNAADLSKAMKLKGSSHYKIHGYLASFSSTNVVKPLLREATAVSVPG